MREGPEVDELELGVEVIFDGVFQGRMLPVGFQNRFDGISGSIVVLLSSCWMIILGIDDRHLTE